MTIHRLILDELREHDTWDAWNAAYNAMNAVSDAQCWAITNMGSEGAVVLNSLRSEAVDTDDNLRPPGEVDPQLGLFEYSAPPGSRADDPAALAAANPNLGRRIMLQNLLADARRAIRNGGEELMTFLTEVLCLRVKIMNPAVDSQAWTLAYDPADPHRGGCLDPGGLEDARSRVALCFDVAPDMQHVTLYAAAVLGDGRVRVDGVAEWSGPHATRQLRRELAGHVGRVRPAVLGWYPSGPGAAVAAEMARKPGWPPRGVRVEEIRAEMTSVCMGFGELIGSRQVAHSGDPLLTAHVSAAEKQPRGDGWVFTRKSGHVDATYAAAGAVHLARKTPPKRRRVVTATSAQRSDS